MDNTYNEKIKLLRHRAGLGEAETAKAIGLNLPSYYDLESYPDEVIDVTSLAELFKMCKVLNCNPTDIFGGTENVNCDTKPEELQNAIRRRVDVMSLGEYESAVGWDVHSFLTDYNAAVQWNVRCVMAIAFDLHLNWQAVILGLFNRYESNSL